MENKNKLVIDDGSKVYTIENKSGQVLGEISFNPSDTNIIQRYENFRKFFENLKEEEYPKTAEGLKKLEEDIVKQVDCLLRSNTKDTIFAIAGPTTPLVTGELFFENVANAIAVVIEAELGVRMKKMQTRVKKYTEKYQK